MQTVVELKSVKKVDEETVAAFVVLENKKVFEDEELFYNKTFLGASLEQIAKKVVKDFDYSTITINEGDYEAAFSQIKLLSKKAETIVVIFADACIIEDVVLSHAINKCATDGVVNLNKSFVCTKKYLKNASLKKIMAEPVFDLARENKVINPKTYVSDLEFAFQNVIVHNLVKKGVKFLSLTDIKIDFSVQIGSGTIINSGATIVDSSVVGKDCFIEHAIIKCSSVAQNCKITDIILDEVTIGQGRTISGMKGVDTPTLKQVTIE